MNCNDNGRGCDGGFFEGGYCVRPTTCPGQEQPKPPASGLRPCFFPHNTIGSKVGVFHEQLGTISSYWVGCSCGARGPWSTDVDEAKKMWNAVTR